MEDGCSEVRGGGLSRVRCGDSEMELEDTCGEGGMCRASDEDVKLGKVVVVRSGGRKEVIGRERIVVQGAMVRRQTAQCARVLESVSGG